MNCSEIGELNVKNKNRIKVKKTIYSEVFKQVVLLS